MSDDCVLIFGISGVGKTTACADFVDRHPQFLHLRASAILSEARSRAVEALRNAEASEINSNQQILVEALNSIREENPNRPMLIDAHAVIDNDRELVRVPGYVVRAIKPTGLVLLEAPAEDVRIRRSADSRYRPMRTIAAIRSEMAAEREAVTEFARELGVPLVIRTVEATFKLDEALEAVLRTNQSKEV